MKGLLRSTWFKILLGLVCVLLIVWFVVVDLLVESMIEKYGSERVGAKVELSGADLSLFPAGIELTGLQVTNPHEPMENALDVRRVSGNLELAPLFRKKIIIPELAMEGVKLGTKRTASGALPGRPAPEKTKPAGICSESKRPSLTIPDAQNILEKEDLESLAIIRSLQDRIDSARQSWQQRLAELPDAEELEAYQKQLEGLSDQKDRSLGSLLSSGSQAVSVAKELRGDLERIEKAKNDFQSELSQLRQQVDSARQAQMRDVSRLKEKYGLSAEGLENLSALLFGETLCTWSSRAIDWYKRLKPILEGRGQGGKAPEAQPEQPAEPGQTPDFLVREAKVSLDLSAGDFSGRIENITTNQPQFGKPMTFDFSGSQLSRLGSISLTGAFDHTNPQMYKDVLNMALKDLKISEASLSKSEGWSLMLQNGLLDLDLESAFQSGSLMAEAKAGLASANFVLPQEQGAGALADAVAGALKDVTGLQLTAQVTGSLEEYALRLSSDVDKILRQSAAKAVRQQTAQLEKQLRQAVTSKTEKPLEALQTNLTGYRDIGETLQQRLQLGREVLSDAGLSF